MSTSNAGGAGSNDSNATRRQSKRPKYSKFTQQELPACKPILTPRAVISAFLIVTIVFIPIGVASLIASHDVVEIIDRYDLRCIPSNVTDKVAYIQTPGEKQCNRQLTVDKRMKSPIYVYYQLDNFYQNHRRYVKSRNDEQLRDSGKANSVSGCEPENNANGKAILPCGLIAWSLFNDTYSFSRNSKNLTVNKKDISWKSDRDHKFGSDVFPKNFQNGSIIGGGSLNESIPEMAPRKLASKRSRKDKAAEGTSSAPEYDSHRFRSAEHQQRFEAIKGWSFLRERRVQLRDDEYIDFQEEIVRRQWASLVTPMAKFDPDIVLEFYANAWPTEEGVRDMRSWVRGQWIPFDADAFSQFLGYPLVLEERQECEYGQRRNRADGFDEEAITQLLCIPGQDFARTAAGRRVRIMRTNMTTLTQIWMTLLLSNIQPSDHNSDLPLPKCQLVYAILTRMSIHVAQLIANAIYLFAGMAPTRHPLDPDKSNRALRFPALITGLCQSFRVPVAPSKVIRPPITRAFIEKYCTQRQLRGMLRRPQTRRHLIMLTQLDHLIRSCICGIWFASRRPTTGRMYRPMIVFTS